MNRVDEFELRVADWLEDGPVDAPEGALATAFEHARTHPRRALSRAAVRRRVMSQLKITQVAPRAPHTGWMVAAAAAVVVLVVGGAAIGTNGFGLWSQGQGVPVGPTASPTVPSTLAPTPQPTPLPSPVAFTGTVTHVSTPELGTLETQPDAQVWHNRVERSTTKAADPRLTGVLTQTLVRREFSDGMSNFDGTGTLVTDGGSWSLQVNGVESPVVAGSALTSYALAVLGTGSGGYAGLVFDAWVSGTAAALDMTGTIRALAPGDLTAVVQFIGNAPPDSKIVYGVEQIRDYVFQVDVSVSSDPLLTGGGTMTLSSDNRADGTGTDWGTLKIGYGSSRSWTARLTGGTGTDGRHVLTGRLFGSGDAAGRALDVTLVSGRGLLFNMIGIAEK